MKTTLRMPKSLLDRARAMAGDDEVSELMRAGIEAEIRRRERRPKKDTPDG